MSRVFFVLLLVSVLAVSLLNTGCDAMAVTDMGFVTSQLRKYSRAICTKDFPEANRFHSPDMIWHLKTTGEGLSGKAATDGFLGSISGIKNMDSFYVYLHKQEQPDPERIIFHVTMQVHMSPDSMTMTYDNLIWQAKIVWTRSGKASWHIAGIQETTERVSGMPPKGCMPL